MPITEKRLKEIKDQEIDLTDLPEQSEEFFKAAKKKKLKTKE